MYEDRIPWWPQCHTAQPVDLLRSSLRLTSSGLGAYRNNFQSNPAAAMLPSAAAVIGSVHRDRCGAHLSTCCARAQMTITATVATSRCARDAAKLETQGACCISVGSYRAVEGGRQVRFYLRSVGHTRHNHVQLHQRVCGGEAGMRTCTLTPTHPQANIHILPHTQCKRSP